LHEEGIFPDYIAGTSIGAVIGAVWFWEDKYICVIRRESDEEEDGWITTEIEEIIIEVQLIQ
jgi:predicted acylesterase/phospholipase RssA